MQRIKNYFLDAWRRARNRPPGKVVKLGHRFQKDEELYDKPKEE